MIEMPRAIPLSKLQQAKENARKTHRDAEIEALAASIAAHGLLQNLTVRPARADGDGKSDGRYEVIAGGRRLLALKRLAKEKRIPKGFAVPCQVLEKAEDNDVLELSLAENVIRVPLHPADQFEAFSNLIADGQGVEEIAARFGVTSRIVLQRLKLAAVSPRLMQAYREGEMTLDQLTAFTISDDHAAQERIWFESPSYDKASPAIRRLLTKALVEGSDRPARFIGAEAYQTAGGTIVRDLFRDADDGYFADSELLDRLVAEKLAQETEAVKQEGWSWVEVLQQMDYEYLARFRRHQPKEVPLSEEDEAKLQSLSERHDQLVSELDDEPDEAMVAELDRISEEMDRLSAAREEWSEEDKARAGAILSIDFNGQLDVTRGLVRPEARQPAQAAATSGSSMGTPEDSVAGATGGEAAEASPSDDKREGYSDALLEELSAHRTAALREAVASQPEVALTALLHGLVLRTFYGPGHETCVDIRPVSTDLSPYGDRVGESRAVAAMAERHQGWSEQLPEEADDLWTWLFALASEARQELLAYSVGRTMNAVRHRYDGDQSERMATADLIAAAGSLNMADWWKPERPFLERLTKAQLVEVVSEAAGPSTAEKLTKLGKSDLVTRAGEILLQAGWLPPQLRPAAPQNAAAA